MGFSPFNTRNKVNWNLFSTPQVNVPEPENDYHSRMADLMSQWQQEGPAFKQYTDYIQNVPQRENYKPGFMNRLAAALGGFDEGYRYGGGRGLATAIGTLETPYRNAVQDWQLQGAGLRAAADIESEGMQRRNAYTKALMDQLQWEKNYEQRDRNIQSQINTRGENLRVAQGNLQARQDAERARAGRWNKDYNLRVGNRSDTQKYRDWYRGFAEDRESRIARGSNKPLSFGEEFSLRRLVERDVLMANPEWVNSTGNAPKPEYLKQFNDLVNAEVSRRKGGRSGRFGMDIELPNFEDDMEDEDEFEEIP